MLAANQQAQRDLAERNDEIDKLAGRIRELEQALLNSAESNRSVSQLEQELHRAKLREQELIQVRPMHICPVHKMYSNVLFLVNVFFSLRISRHWSSSSCLTGFRFPPCSLNWMRHDTVTMTTCVTPPRSLGMPWTLLSRVYRAKSKRSVRLNAAKMILYGCWWLLI